MINPLAGDTIAAIATPAGIGAISVIRVSGVNLIKLYSLITKSKDAPVSRYANYSKIYNENGECIDSCIIIFYKAPKRAFCAIFNAPIASCRD